MKKNPIHISYGIITSLTLNAIVALLLILKVKTSGNLNMILTCSIIASGILASCFALKKSNQAATGKDVFFHGFRTTTIIALLQIVFGLLVLLLFPSIKNEQITAFNTEATAIAKAEAKLYSDTAMAKTKDALTLNAIMDSAAKLETIGIAKATKDTADYKKRFLTFFIGLNMMIAVILGLGASAMATLIVKK
jgi:hypothetical protein